MINTWRLAPRAFRLYNAAAIRCAQAAALAVLASAAFHQDVYPAAMVLAGAVCARSVNAAAIRFMDRRLRLALCEARA